MLRQALISATLLCAPPAFGQVSLDSPSVGSGLMVSVTTMRDIPFRTVIRQQYDFSCGSAALATLLTYQYGLPTRESDVFKEMFLNGNQEKIRKVGFSMLDMKRYLKTRGIEADGYHVDFDDLRQAAVPAIVLITLRGYKHFVVIKGIEADRILVGDSALGLRKMSVAEFRSVWNGVVFAVHGSFSDKAEFNLTQEWQPSGGTPFRLGVDEASAAQLTRELPPIFQITPALQMTTPIPITNGVP